MPENIAMKSTTELRLCWYAFSHIVFGRFFVHNSLALLYQGNTNLQDKEAQYSSELRIVAVLVVDLICKIEVERRTLGPPLCSH